MRISVLALIALFQLLPGRSLAIEPGARERTFLHALEVFDAAKSPDDYRQSAAFLESLLADGYRNGAVYYNMGNAYFRAGEYGRSIAAYRRAKLYRPRDPYLEANLQQALSVAPGRLPEPPSPWWRHVLFWSGWLSFPEKAYASFTGFLLGALVAIAALLLRRPRMYWITAAIVAMAVVLSIDTGLTYADIASARHGVSRGFAPWWWRGLDRGFAHEGTSRLDCLRFPREGNTG